MQKQESLMEGIKALLKGATSGSVAATLAGASSKSSPALNLQLAPTRRAPAGRNMPTREAVAELVRTKVTIPKVGISELLGQYVDPASHTPVRLPDVSSASCVGTAISTLFVADTLNWTNTAPSVTDFPSFGFETELREPILSDASSRLVVALRDPVVLGIVSAGPWDPAVASTYTYQSLNMASPADAPEITWKTPFPLPLGLAFSSAGPLRYGDYMIPGQVAGGHEQVYWIDACAARNATVTVNLVFAFATSNYVNSSLEMVLWADENECNVESTDKDTISGGTTTWSHSYAVGRSGYYSFHLNLDNYQQADPQLRLNSFSVTVSVATALSFDHIVHPSVLDAIVARHGKELVGQARVLGSAVLISNSTANMFKAGTLYSKQCDARAPWYVDVASPEDFTTTNIATSYDGPMSKGVFAIVKPQGPQAFDLLELVDSNVSSREAFAYRPFMGCGTVVTLLCPGDAAFVSGTVSTSVVIHWARGFEFTTQNQLFLVDTSKIRRVDMLAFMDELSRFPQFFENPLHLRDIGALMKKAGGWAWDNKSSILEVAKLLSSLRAAM